MAEPPGREALADDLVIQEVILASLQAESFDGVERERDEARREIARLKTLLAQQPRSPHDDGDAGRDGRHHDPLPHTSLVDSAAGSSDASLSHHSPAPSTTPTGKFCTLRRHSASFLGYATTFTRTWPLRSTSCASFPLACGKATPQVTCLVGAPHLGSHCFAGLAGACRNLADRQATSSRTTSPSPLICVCACFLGIADRSPFSSTIRHHGTTQPAPQNGGIFHSTQVRQEQRHLGEPK